MRYHDTLTKFPLIRRGGGAFSDLIIFNGGVLFTLTVQTFPKNPLYSLDIAYKQSSLTLMNHSWSPLSFTRTIICSKYVSSWLETYKTIPIDKFHRIE